MRRTFYGCLVVIMPINTIICLTINMYLGNNRISNPYIIIYTIFSGLLFFFIFFFLEEIRDILNDVEHVENIMEIEFDKDDGLEEVNI